MQGKTMRAAGSVSDLLAGLDLKGQTWCYTNLGDAAGFSLPRTDAVLFHMVLHGSVKMACGRGRTLQLGAGDAVIVLPGEAHALRTAGASRAEMHDFLCGDHDLDIPETIAVGSGTAVARLLSGRLHPQWPRKLDRSALPIMLPLERNEGGLTAALLKPEALPSAGIGAGATALLTQFALLLLIAGLRSSPHCRELVSRPERDPIGLALQIIQGAPAENWTVERLAQAVGMGRSNFCAHFTQHVGHSPMELVTRLRMEKAAALLRGGKFKIAEVSEIVGYGSEAAFSRRFSRHFGISPKQIREHAWPGTQGVGEPGNGQGKLEGDWLPAGITGNVILDWQTEWRRSALQ